MAQESLITNDNAEIKENSEPLDYKHLEKCPYCSGKLVKKGVRKKKHEEVQVYFCSACSKKITPLI